MLVQFVAAWLAWGGGLTGEAAEIPPSTIVGGETAQQCQWPTAVAMLEDDSTPSMCSGTLIHSDVVMTAAHCIVAERPIVAVGFGEHSEQSGVPERQVPIMQCVQHPDFLEQGWPDIGYCRLQQPVTDVPIVPALSGCETAALQIGTHAQIVGFGATFGEVDEDGNGSGSGVGTKRHTTQFIDDLSYEESYVALTWNTGSNAACFGDSGGPAYAQLADGTWRVFGVAAHLYDPGDLPAPKIPGNVCGPGAIYTYATPLLAWIENSSGFDVTPCWAGDVYAPDGNCGVDPAAPHTGEGTWAGGCVGGSVVQTEPSCDAVEPPPLPPPPEPPPEPEPPPPEPPPDDDAGDDIGDDGDGDDGAPPGDDGEPQDDDGMTQDGGRPADDTGGEIGGTAGSSGGLDLAASGLEPRGCTCRSTADDSRWWLLTLLALPVARRRRRASAAS